MNYIYLRSKIDRYSLALQEHNIKEYMLLNDYEVGPVHVEISPVSKKIEERQELREFIHSLKSDDRLFIYDLRVISQRVGEVIQFLGCIFNHNLELIVTKYGVKIDKNTPASVVVSLLNRLREENKGNLSHTGRPKGSISKSKYDKYKTQIIELLKEGRNVSEIAKILNASRSSIRDYITSRELEKIALGEKKGHYEVPKSTCKINHKG